MYGPTLLDLADHLSVGVGSVATMFAVLGIGSIVGAAVNGVLLDRLEMLSFSILSVSIFGAVISKFSIGMHSGKINRYNIEQ